MIHYAPEVINTKKLFTQVKVTITLVSLEKIFFMKQHTLLKSNIVNVVIFLLGGNFKENFIRQSTWGNFLDINAVPISMSLGFIFSQGKFSQPIHHCKKKKNTKITPT